MPLTLRMKCRRCTDPHEAVLLAWQLRSPLRRFRLASGLTGESLAHRVGVSARSVVDWEAGHHAPSFESAIRIAREFHLPVGEFLEMWFDWLDEGSVFEK